MSAFKDMANDGQEAADAAGSVFETIKKIAGIAAKVAAVGFLLKRAFDLSPPLQKFVRGLGDAILKVGLFRRGADAAAGALKKIMATQTGRSIATAIGLPIAIKGFAALAGVIVAANVAFAAFLLKTARSAGMLRDSAQILDTTTQRLQALKFAAAATRANFEDLQEAIANIRNTQSEAIAGNEQMRKEYERLGISMADLEKLNADQIFDRISRQFSAGTISAGNYSSVIDVMGKRSKALFPAMEKGIAEMAEFWKKVFVNSKTTIDSLDLLDRKWQFLKAGAIAFTSYGLKGFAGFVMKANELNAALVDVIGSYMKLGNPSTAAGFLGSWNAAVDRLANAGLALFDSDHSKSLELQEKLKQRAAQQASVKAAQAREISELKAKNDENQRELDLAKMTNSERRKALELERAMVKAGMEAVTSDLVRQQLRERLIEIDKKIEQTRSNGSQATASRNVDQFTRVGIVRATALDRQVAIQREILNKHNQQLRALDRILRETERNTRAVESV